MEIDTADSHIFTAATTTTRMNISSNRPAKRYAFRGQGQIAALSKDLAFKI
jgi:hypothetical protein